MAELWWSLSEKTVTLLTCPARSSCSPSTGWRTRTPPTLGTQESEYRPMIICGEDHDSQNSGTRQKDKCEVRQGRQLWRPSAVNRPVSGVKDSLGRPGPSSLLTILDMGVSLLLLPALLAVYMLDTYMVSTVQCS